MSDQDKPFNAPRLRLPADPRLDVKTPRCPLCHKEMVREARPAKNCYVFACKMPGCKVAIRVDDPFVGRWEEALKDERIPCPNEARCPKAGEAKLRYFATRTGYMKAVCSRDDGGCGAAIAFREPERPEGQFYSPEKKGLLQ